MSTDLADQRILILDDEADSLKLAHDILTLKGADVYCATNSDEFYRLWQSVSPSVAIVDLAMPKPDGWDVVAHVRAAPAGRQTHMIAMTAYCSENVVSQVFRAGFEALIAKPLRGVEMVEIIRQVLNEA